MTTIAHARTEARWLLFIFTLPTKAASQRVEAWRKLRRYGALALRSGGHVLPNTPANREHFEWLGAMIRKSAGSASVMRVHSFDDHSDARLQQLFLEERSSDYEALIADIRKLTRLRQKKTSDLPRMRRRFQEVTAIDFFNSPLRSRVETLFAQMEEYGKSEPIHLSNAKTKAKAYRNRMWITRPRPGIDRVSSAWLIRNFIDAHAKFIFDDDPAHHPNAVPFDMFQTKGFGHRGDDCTFETLCKEFSIRDRRVRTIAQMIHDADLEDEKFGRFEGLGLDRTLIGWAKNGASDEELLRRGMELIEGLYAAVS
jgi:hypothetical protein